MKFHTLFDKPNLPAEKFNKKTQDIYKSSLNTKTGKLECKKIGKVNVYEKIQEYKEETQIQTILQKYNVSLQSQLKDSEQELVDLTNLPENLLETMTAIKNAEYLWERQAKEVKAKFNNDFRQFIAGSENGQIAKMLQEHLKTKTEKFSPEVQKVAELKPTPEPKQEGIITNV